MTGPTNPTATRSPFLAFVESANDQETLRKFAGSQGWPDSGVLQGNISTAAEFLAKHASPTLLVVEMPGAEQAPSLLDKLANVVDPDTKVVIVGAVNEYSFYCWLTEIGIFSYLLTPLSTASLEGMWQKATEPAASAAKASKPPAVTIGVIGTRGGVGGTTMAIALSAMLAGKGHKKTALVDLDPQDGSASLLLELEPSRGFREALEKPDRIDNLFLDRVMNKADCGVYVLSAEEGMQERVNFHDHAADALLKELRDKFEVIVLDLPRISNTFYRTCLKSCDHVVAVSDLTLQGLRDALRLSDMCRDHLRTKPPVFVANRVGMAAKFEMPLGDFAKSLKAEVKHSVPFAPELFMDIAAALKSEKNAGTPAMKVVRQVAHSLLSAPEAKQDGAGKPFLKLFNKK